MSERDFGGLPLGQQELIDRLCVEFEDRWLESPRPAMGPLLERAPADLRGPLLAELIKIDIDYCRRRGESPRTAEYRRAHPDGAPAMPDAQRLGPPGPAADELALVPGEIVHRYRILRPIAEGGFGRVYQARDEDLGRDVALKTIPEGGQAAELLLEEARTAARMKHPGIVPIYDLGRLPDGRPYLVMEHVEGPSLDRRLAEDPLACSVASACHLVARVADTIDWAHRRGVIHRDLSPSNILLDDSQGPRLTDFGLALHQLQQRQRAGEIAGSLPYMAPEQLAGKSQHLDGRADVWSLGVILYELVCGRRPFAGATADELRDEILHRPAPPMRRAAGRIPRWLERTCMRCLSKQPEERMTTAADLAAALRLGPRRRTLGLLAAGVLAAGGALLLWPPPRWVDLQVTVWRGNREHPFPAATLRGGDLIALRVEASRASHLHAWWINSRGRVDVIHEDQKRRAEVRLPLDPQTAWPLPARQPGGLETVVVLVSRLPLEDEDVPGGPPGPPPAMRLSAPQWYVDGQWAPAGTRRLHREGPVKTPVEVETPLADWHRQLAERLRPHGDVVAVTYYCEPSGNDRRPELSSARPHAARRFVS